MNRTRWLVLALALVMGIPIWASPSRAAAADPGGDVASNLSLEANARKLQSLADANGALGMYVDASTGEYVVVFSEAGGAKLSSAQASSVGLAVRVETRPIDSQVVGKITDDLMALHGNIAKVGGAYEFSFNPETGKVDVLTDTSFTSFDTVTKAFPGLVTYQKAVIESTSWDNDGQPHWGGAWLQSSAKLCTSGWAMQDNNNHRWMVTAGHCFPQGVSTNMGTSIRDDGYNNWGIDVARITGQTYAGKIYADGANGARAVKDGNDPVVGASYCTTGRASGFWCGWVDHGNNHTVCYPNDPCFSHLAAVWGSQLAVVQDGDSGGPFFIKDGSLGVGVRGIISGKTLVDPARPGNWVSLIQQYHSIADFYVSHVVTQ